MGCPVIQPGDALVIVARYPEKGQVKTRLAVEIGESRAFELYRAFLTDMMQKFNDSPWKLFWAYTPAHAPFDRFCSSACFPQDGEILPERLLNIFKRFLGRGYRKVGIMSSDVPHMPVSLVDESFRLLETADSVFIPADDGGYNLVGLKSVHDIFRGIRMSVPEVLANTIQRAKSMGLSVAATDSIFDVDEYPDLEALNRWAREHPADIPATGKILDQIFPTKEK